MSHSSLFLEKEFYCILITQALFSAKLGESLTIGRKIDWKRGINIEWEREND